MTFLSNALGVAKTFVQNPLKSVAIGANVFLQHPIQSVTNPTKAGQDVLKQSVAQNITGAVIGAVSLGAVAVGTGAVLGSTTAKAIAKPIVSTIGSTIQKQVVTNPIRTAVVGALAPAVITAVVESPTLRKSVGGLVSPVENVGRAESIVQKFENLPDTTKQAISDIGTKTALIGAGAGLVTAGAILVPNVIERLREPRTKEKGLIDELPSDVYEPVRAKRRSDGDVSSQLPMAPPEINPSSNQLPSESGQAKVPDATQTGLPVLSKDRVVRKKRRGGVKKQATPQIRNTVKIFNQNINKARCY